MRGILHPGSRCRVSVLPKHQSQELGPCMAFTRPCHPTAPLPPAEGRDGAALLLARAFPPGTFTRQGPAAGLTGGPRPVGAVGPLRRPPLGPVGTNIACGVCSGVGGLLRGRGSAERERGPSSGSSLRPYLTFRQLSLSLSKGHG